MRAERSRGVTAVDVSVRPAESSPWSKGTLFKGEGFSVSETTGNGWAYGRAGGGADRCGWVLISEISSTNRTDNTCGSPKSEPLGDSEHVPGGGPSERWFVTCESATLHRNYGGGPGQLRTPAGTVARGTALGWRYTTGDNYASSVDGPTGTPRFILRSCISRTPPAGPAPDPGPTPTPAPAVALVGPPPLRLLDEDILFERFRTETTQRAEAALADLVQRGQPVTFRGLAKAAGVSVDFLYRSPIRARIEELRAARQPARTESPANDAGGESPVARALAAQLRELKRRHREELADLRRALAVAQGENLELRRRLGRPAPSTPQ